MFLNMYTMNSVDTQMCVCVCVSKKGGDKKGLVANVFQLIQK
jgi:hypothetical protein